MNDAGILSDSEIHKAVECGDIVIDPFDPTHLNPVSYDLTLGDTYLTYLGTLDARQEPRTEKRTFDSEYGLTLHPGVGYLMHTVERIWTEKYVPILDGKSSIARLFMKVHETAGYGDPGFDGQYTLEVTVGDRSLRIYAGMRVAQIRFHTIVGEVEKPYAGNYTGETARGPVASRAWKQFVK